LFICGLSYPRDERLKIVGSCYFFAPLILPVTVKKRVGAVQVDSSAQALMVNGVNFAQKMDRSSALSNGDKVAFE
jgi:hypothetical protein